MILIGCTGRIKEPVRICPGKESAYEVVSILRSRSQSAVPLKAIGQCRLRYFVEEKKNPHKENFPVRLWLNPPAEICLQGDVAFDPRGIVLSSNKDEFWLAVRLKEISSYWWGRWAETGYVDKLVISPKTVLEALGIVAVSGEDDDTKSWSLSNEGAFDVLTMHNNEGRIIKKVYIYSCDYLVRKIEYFDINGEVAIVTELSKYERVVEDFFVPAGIKIIKHAENNKTDSIQISLGSIKPAQFSQKLRSRLYTRPEPKGFKHVYKIVDGNMVKQLQ